jgi:hypothetical protein
MEQEEVLIGDGGASRQLWTIDQDGVNTGTAVDDDSDYVSGLHSSVVKQAVTW